MAGDVERLEAWQLPAYLRHLAQGGTSQVTWNAESIPLDEAQQRAASLSETATVVVDGTTVYVAEPDHSADEPVRFNPLQIQKRRPS